MDKQGALTKLRRLQVTVSDLIGELERDVELGPESQESQNEHSPTNGTPTNGTVSKKGSFELSDEARQRAISNAASVDEEARLFAKKLQQQ